MTYPPVPVRLERLKDILAHSTVCYHSWYTLTYRGQGADSWFVLAGDSAAPLDRRQAGVILEDSAGVLTEWWRSTAFEPRPDHQPNGWKPGSISFIEMSILHDVRGRLTYNDSAITGTIHDYTEGWEWGVEGVRKPCPSLDVMRETKKAR